MPIFLRNGYVLENFIAFPAYIILLVVIIIIISEHSTRFSRLIGRKNPVATLTTLILLSYTKLISIIITSLSFCTLNYPDGSCENSLASWWYSTLHEGKTHTPFSFGHYSSFDWHGLYRPSFAQAVASKKQVFSLGHLSSTSGALSCSLYLQVSLLDWTAVTCTSYAVYRFSIKRQ